MKAYKTTTFTDFETKLIENLLTNDYGDVPHHEIWTWAWDCGKHGAFCENASIGGVVASLVKKGIIDTRDDGEDSTIWIKENALDKIRHLIEPEWRKHYDEWLTAK